MNSVGPKGRMEENMREGKTKKRTNKKENN